MELYKKIEKILVEKLGCDISEFYYHFIVFYFKDIQFRCVFSEHTCDIKCTEKGEKKYIISVLLEMIINDELKKEN